MSNAQNTPAVRLPQLLSAGASLVQVAPNLWQDSVEEIGVTQEQTRQAFGQKWAEFDYNSDDYRRNIDSQRKWYLDLYGFASEADFADYLRDCQTIIDCGAGMAGKAAWFASLAPHATVVAVEISDSVVAASQHFQDKALNLIFVRGNIGAMPFFADGSFDYVNCDQVIHHTENPPATFAELVRLTKPGRELTSYVYRRKALPRELLDDHFRVASQSMTHDELMALSEQLTDLGKMLDETGVELDFPAIPALGIEGGRQSLQRFLYWNFIKCFWNEEHGRQNSVMTNYDWYSPSQAYRYSEAEFRQWLETHKLGVTHFHMEQACYSGRFRKPETAASGLGA